MVTIARLLNLTLVVPELDKKSFWADHRYIIFVEKTVFSNLAVLCHFKVFFLCSGFEDIFDVRHFIDSLRDEVRIVKRVPKKFSRKSGYLEMPPVSWSNEKYYLHQVCGFYLLHLI